MHEELWAGVELKLQNAEFHLQQMERSLEPIGRTQTDVALQAAGAILDTRWQQSFYAHLDAFLSAARSIPEIIRCCFGVDKGHSDVSSWFGGLSTAEQDRRRAFMSQFKISYEGFRDLPLGKARHIIEHRTGVAPVEVTISGRFGLIYVGSPIRPVPNSETRPLDDSMPSSVAQPILLGPPSQNDFNIEGQPLFPACRNYLKEARSLIKNARSISGPVHGTNNLATPPN